MRLLHRWFVQYNPLYLASAALVLVGLTLLSRALVEQAPLWGSLAVASASELYAFALIGSAALLTHLGLRRPAVFVALIAVLYQGDLSLGNETRALLGLAGVVGNVVWTLLFVVKLRLLASALRLELSRSSVAVSTLGAIGIGAIPLLSRRVDTHTLTVIVGLWLFTLSCAGLWTARQVSTTQPLDAWGRTVMRRSLRAAWTSWAGLAVAHALFWITQYRLDVAILAPIALLLPTRWIRSEVRVVASVVGTLAFVAIEAPALLQTAAFMAAITLALHAVRKPIDPDEAAANPPRRDDYRTGLDDAAGALRAVRFAPSPMPARIRQLAWAGCALYLGVWTFSWAGGDWPSHAWALDLVLLGTTAMVLAFRRVPIVALPVVATYVHWSIQARIVTAPRSMLAWGITTFAVGFGLLFAAVLASWRTAAKAPLTPSGSPAPGA